MIPGSNTGFQSLTHCLVGRCYPPEFFGFIKNAKIRGVFEKVSQETEEDYQKLLKILHGFGVTTHRPILADDFGMYLYQRDDGFEEYKRPPMQPRDDMIVIGDRLFVVHLGHGDGYLDPWDHLISKIDKHHVEDHRTDYQIWKKVAPPCITRIGRDLYFDFYSHDPNYSRQSYFDMLQSSIIPKYFADYRIHFVDCGGHSDAVFCPVVPGLIVTYEDPVKYQMSFPAWEVIQVSHGDLTKNDQALKALKKTQGKWWIKNVDLDTDLIEFVSKNFQGWTGYSIETVFDVNMLVIDEQNVIVNSENPTIMKAFERRGISAHVCAFRHRFFWDCGLHCATLDLRREGDIIDYFS